ncbi:MAG: hypothetical protein IT353_20090 [Gemmatimonadaceae bacterium]|nr:hypothetical protein [Gemmatimonadaceae bacterium]
MPNAGIRARALLVVGVLFTLLGCGGGGDTPAPTPVAPQTPTIALGGGTAVTVQRGATTTVTISVTRGGGYTGAVDIVATGVPAGVTLTLNPTTIPAGSTTSVATLVASASATAATSQISITGTGAGVSAASTLITLTVAAPAPTTLTSLGLGSVNERFTAELWVRGTTAYTTTWGTRSGTGRGNAIKIWDVSANAPPVLVDSIIVASTGTLGDVQVSDDGTLLVAGIEPTPNGGLAVYALDTPRSARLLARTTGGELRFGVHTAEIARVDGVLYAFCAVDPANGVAARLVIVSLANPAQPTIVASLELGDPFIHDVFVRDGILFTAEWNDGVGVWDIGGGGTGGTVAVPKRLAQVPSVGGEVHNMWWYHDPVTSNKRYLFVGQEGPGVIGSSSAGDIHVFDVSVLAAPTEVARYTVPGAGAHNFSVDEANGLLYAAYYNAGVRVLDVRGDLRTCAAAERLGDGRCDLGLMGREKAVFASASYVWGVHWSSSGLFASDMLNGLWRITPATR